MNIIYYHPLFNAQEWLAGIKQRLPQAEVREWQRGDERPAGRLRAGVAPAARDAGQPPRSESGVRPRRRR